MICGHRATFESDRVYLPDPVIRAISFLSETDLSAMAPGRIDIDGDRMFAMLSEARTAPACDGDWEAHRLYADLQYLIRGDELIGWAANEGDRSFLRKEGEDCFFFPVPSAPCWMHLSPGGYVVFFPSDLHCPLRTWGDPCTVRKIVVKISMSMF